jgi:hypothetical protein
MGVDSTAILLRWLLEPASRPCSLDQLVIVTAQTGDEWAQTRDAVEAHVLPLVREAGVRMIQVARSQRHVRKGGEGVVVLNDSCFPQRLYTEGAFSLSDELRSAGTVPQVGGSRLCSVHSKGDCLDPVLDRLFGDRPFTHVLGFEANEIRRAERDARYNTLQRTGSYPLVEWAWTRDDAISYIKAATGGGDIPKSACYFCPFALSNKTSRAHTLQRYQHDPAQAAQALMIEHTSLALNRFQGLVGDKRLIDFITALDDPTPILTAFHTTLQGSPHAVYRIRRIYREDSTRPGVKGKRVDRAVQRLAVGDRSTMRDLARTLGDEQETDGLIERIYRRRRAEVYPTVEEFVVAAPAVVNDKQSMHFDRWWDQFTASTESRQHLDALHS